MSADIATISMSQNRPASPAGTSTEPLRRRPASRAPGKTPRLTGAADCHYLLHSRKGGQHERCGDDVRDDRRLSPGGGGAEAEWGRYDLWGGGHPDHRFAALGAERGHPLPRL